VVDDRAPKVCQHWSTDIDGNPIEPGQCPNWDDGDMVCTFVDEDGNRAEFYPFCNVVGTQTRCGQYAGTISAVQARCIAPDPDRSKVNRVWR